MASRSDTWMLTSTVRSSSLASIMRTGISATATPAVRGGLGLQQFGVAREVARRRRPAPPCAGRRDQRRDLAAQRGARAQVTASAASRPASALDRPHAAGAAAGPTCSTGCSAAAPRALARRVDLGDRQRQACRPAAPRAAAHAPQVAGDEAARVSSAACGTPWR
jgi:hypothetical protein